MPMLSSAFCLQCVKMFDLESRKMCTGKCNHSICETCFDKKLSNSCPTCETVDAFEVKNINYQAQEMLSEVMKNISIADRLKGIKSRNIGEGACSECQLPSRRLRVCVDCSTRSGLLILDKDGSLQLSTETVNELLETKILRIHSVAICADCALDGTKHKGHKLEFVTNINHMKSTLEALDTLSAITLFSQKIEDEAKDCKQMTALVAFCSSLEECIKMQKSYLELTGESENESSVAIGSTSLFKIVQNCALGMKPLVKDMLLDEIKESKKLMMKAKSEKERNEWKKIIEKLEYYRDHCYSEDTSFDWKSNVLEAIKVYESGILGEIIKLPTNPRAAREISDITKDLRRTMKLPKEVEKYVNVAGSVLQFFFGGEEKKVEELDLD